ncbi:cytochrome b/b6 domain-containing protein [Xylophilus rhododendri]|uniref:cytochrome b/b6 domain-containing protein n=1 Tax=Xylophilus rhododendri TaxID=2697032 RepID=UPI001E62A70B|nr:cytochrome b/b6 domain-containing protein [Xylophilus rhododendri]
MKPGTVRVWDWLVRLTHWLVAVGVALAWFTSEGSEAWHIRIGYTIAAAVAVRVAWGFIGSRHARFADFLRGPRATLAYARRLMAGREERHLGHNPLGGWMAVALWLTVAGTCFTGWLYTTDAFFGLAWLDQLHQLLAWTVVALVPLHVAGVVFTSLRHRENLVAAMLAGDKRAED